MGSNSSRVVALLPLLCLQQAELRHECTWSPGSGWAQSGSQTPCLRAGPTPGFPVPFSRSMGARLCWKGGVLGPVWRLQTLCLCCCFILSSFGLWGCVLKCYRCSCSAGQVFSTCHQGAGGRVGAALLTPVNRHKPCVLWSLSCWEGLPTSQPPRPPLCPGERELRVPLGVWEGWWVLPRESQCVSGKKMCLRCQGPEDLQAMCLSTTTVHASAHSEISVLCLAVRQSVCRPCEHHVDRS